MKIFISYRRDDSAATADYLYQTLQKIFTPRGVFRDIASLPFGIDFATHLRDTLSQCDVILVLIGRGWLDARDEHGNRRLEQPGDPVREEVTLALSSDALVIPVLLDDVPMPDAAQVPADLAPLVRRQAAVLHTDERRTQEAGVIVAVARAFVRRYPRQWLLQRLPLLLPLVTAITLTITITATRLSHSETFISDSVAWVLHSVIWLLPLLYAARWRLWLFFRRLALPYLMFIFLLPFVLNAPSAVGFAAFAVVLVMEGLALRYFAQNIPRSLSLALRAEAAGTPPAAPARPAEGAQPAADGLSFRFRRLLTWGVVAVALLCILTAVAGGALAVGRDFASDAPELYWAVNLQLAATYMGIGAIVGAFLALVLDMAQMRSARRSSPWGDAASRRGDGFATSMLLVRLVLFVLPLAIFKLVEPSFFDRATADATQYAVDLTLGSTTFALGALLSLIPLRRRARRA